MIGIQLYNWNPVIYWMNLVFIYWETTHLVHVHQENKKKSFSSLIMELI